jgi:hypothetical protein
VGVCRTALTLAIALALGGCKTRLPTLPVDAGSDGCAAFAHHHLETVPLTLLVAADYQARIGRAVRVRVGVPLRGGCDVLGQIDVGVMPGNATDFVTVVAHRWVGEGMSCPDAAAVERVLVLDGAGNLRVAVRDAAPGATLATTINLGAPMGDCAPAMLHGVCELDCQCTGTGQRCIETGFGFAQCEVPCNEGVDCLDAGLASCGKDSVCQGPPGCRSDADCGFGQTCGMAACRPSQTAAADMPCGCDAECGPGGLCKLTVDLAYCVLPCGTSADCHPDAECVQSQCLPRQR